MPTPHVDKAACYSLGYCWTHCPAVFYEDTDGKANTRDGKTCSDCPTGPGNCLDCQANCCDGAISIT